MKMWTQGLGNVELVFDWKEMEAEKIEGNTVMTGITKEPVQWNYTMTLEKDDIPAFLHIIFKYDTLLFAYRNKGLIFRSLVEALFSKKKDSCNKVVEGNPI